MKSEGKPRGNHKGRGRQPHRKRVARPAAAQPPEDEEEEIRNLEKLIAESAPESGTQAASNGELRFEALPLSFRTQQALKLAKMEVCTEIQAAAIPHALVGRDILGAAKTGSGKTLAFVIPLLEKLYRERWSPEEGLGALIITPTRELALQIFEVLRTVGKKHQFSAGLVTGGKKEYAEEQARIVRMNILVSTPGRLLQHLEQTSGFDASKLLVLVLDEADRILDMGFQTQLDNILSYLPITRQTMLFSATQTKSVKDLARLSLRDAEYLAVHADQSTATPHNLIQNYVLVSLEQKLDTLFSFLKTHTKSKVMVFFSTCAQARFVYELFCSLQPGLPLTALHGKIKQERRTLIYMDFLRRPAACMFATDIAARGLDFPRVDWVVQVDAPEDAAMYIHRVGRTARYTSTGRALLFLLPTEEKTMLSVLQTAGIPLQKLTVNPSRNVSITAKASALLAAHADYRIFAKKAFVGYLRSLTLLPLVPVRDLRGLPLEAFAKSLGLPFTPDVSSLGLREGEEGEGEGEGQGGEEDALSGRQALREKKNVNRTLDKLKRQIAEAKESRRRAKQVAKLRAAGRLAEADALEAAGQGEGDRKGHDRQDDDDEDDDLLVVKQVHNASVDDEQQDEKAKMDMEAFERRQMERRLQRIDRNGAVRVAQQAGRHVLFDDDGDAKPTSGGLLQTEAREEGETSGMGDAALRQRMEARWEAVRAAVDAGRGEDEARDRQRVKDKRVREKQLRDKLRQADQEDDAEREEEEEEEEGEPEESESQTSDSEDSDADDSEDSESQTSETEDSDSDTSESQASEADLGRGPRKRSLQAASLQEQEALALRLLESKRARK